MREPTRGRVFRCVEFAANLSIVIVGLALVAVLWDKWSGGPQQEQTALKVGDSIRLPSGAWQKRPTLVLALSSECRFCAESMPFYRRLTARAGEANLDIVVLMPQEASVARDYLATHGLDGSTIRSVARLDHSTGVPAVPAIVAVGANGLVRDLWLGRLGSEQEQEVLGRLTEMPRW